MLTDILDLSDRELDQLLHALSQGTIGADLGMAQIRRAGFLDHGEIVQSWLTEAAETFGSIEGVIAAIHLLRAGRNDPKQSQAQTELILSGPGTEDTPSRDTRVVVREIFESARRSVLIVGYAFYGSDKIFEPLASRMGADPALRARIIVNIHPDGGRPPEQVIREYAANFLRTSWPFHPRPTIYYLPGSLASPADRRASVHAKLVVADEETVYLGSANFTTAAFRRNIEAGLRLRSATLGRQLVSHFDAMIKTKSLSSLRLD
jgi:phosphatidylserine/phosphatidylglycerophosphate/cardiolipin synthase-like enzyme